MEALKSDCRTDHWEEEADNIIPLPPKMRQSHDNIPKIEPDVLTSSLHMSSLYPQSQPSTTRRRPNRKRNPPSHLNDYHLFGTVVRHDDGMGGGEDEALMTRQPSVQLSHSLGRSDIDDDQGFDPRMPLPSPQPWSLPPNASTRHCLPFALNSNSCYRARINTKDISCGDREGDGPAGVVANVVERSSWDKSRCGRKCCFPTKGGLHHTSGDASLVTQLEIPSWCYAYKSRSASSRRTRVAAMEYKTVSQVRQMHSTLHEAQVMCPCKSEKIQTVQLPTRGKG